MKHVRESGGRHRAKPRPRYDRISWVGASLAVTGIAVVGGFGMLPAGSDRPAAASSMTAGEARDDEPEVTDTPSPAVADPGDSEQAAPVEVNRGDAGARRKAAAPTESTALPPRSGAGRRIVFSESRQRVWLVDGDVQQTYLVSGSATDNLQPGTYAVYSRSRNAVGIDDSGTMEYFVRFAQGTDQGAAIGFHTIPVDDGAPVQKVSELGTPLSHGCIRQKRSHAIALWDFAPIGTTVVVTP